ncbi:PAAR domain-containing protein [Enterobacter bugandensis]|uniref:PAAR domain-containing protein n=1 Tax=Enterobacter bugandensis TaxID=881260 RepID=UPI0020046C48|nr:PAAR domain-containing protein [Enterobacter bugandensis]MCK6732514.1 PAAR domain-containing protein [Enterobacter bugandensis]HCM9224147.1 PAAR domain-containing protein [Enterobacter bugandensis]
MQQYSNEITPGFRDSTSLPPYDEDFLASYDSKTREQFEDFNKHVSRPVTYIFRFTVVGIVTRNASGGSTDGGERMARVGDKVVYAGSGEATIISGAGGVRIIQDTSAALSGSMLDNGDEIISTLQSGNRLLFREGDTFQKEFLTMPGSKH